MALLATGSAVLVPFWLGFDQSGASPNNDSLSLYLKLDESTAGTAADSSGDGNAATAYGGTVASTDHPSTAFVNSHSLSFDGAGDYIESADAPELSSTDLTISAWVKFNALGATPQTIVAKWDVAHWQEYVIQAQDNNLYFYTGDGSNVTSDFIVHSTSLTTGSWYHIAGTISGTARCLSINGSEECDTADASTADSDAALTVGGKQNNAGPYFEFLNGLVDDVRIYDRVLSGGELAELAAGTHTSATWDGSDSEDYEVPGNWDVSVVPDPYTLVTIADSSNQPVASADIGLAGLTIDSGARLNLAGWDLALNDSGVFTNNGTLQLKNSETLSGFTNDTDSGTVLLTPDADITGLKTGNSYNNLILNGSTFAHWPLDETSGPASDVSGFERTATYQGSPVANADTPYTSFANDNSLELDGVDDFLDLGSTSLPTNTTWCGWLKMDSGSGVVLGSASAEKYILKINGGTEVAVTNEALNDTVSWSGLSSIYGNWHHICLIQTYSLPVYSLNLYVDGAAVGATEALDGGIGTVDAIGRGGSSYFDGRIDDIRIYNRALSPTEIDRLYDGSEPATYTSTQTLAANLVVNGNLVLATGRLDVSAADFDISIGGDLRNDGGVFVQQEGEVVLDGADQAINSSMSFYDLTKNVTSAATLTFGKESTTTVANMLTLTGASGQLLSLRSSEPGTQWLLDPAGNETVSYLDVQDSNNISVDPVDITGDNVTDSGNNTGWTVNVDPEVPTGLGPSGLTNGSFTTNTAPTFEFSLADDNPGDQLRFQIQVDNNSDFSSPEIDYISDAGAHGSRSFIPGQNGSDDTYLAGADDMLMVSGSYYWRVSAIDDYVSPHQSAYVVANSGSIAFRLDVTGPTTPGTPVTISASTNRKPVWNWTASTDSGSGLANPAYTLQWSTDNTFNSGVSATTTNSLTFTHSTNLADGQWYFRVRASDTLGNNSAWATSTAHLIDNTGPNTPVAPFTASPTSITTPTWSWAEPVDAGIGLDPSNPYILNWSLTSNFSGTVYSTNWSSNIFTHSTPLGDGTWYMRVRAVDALGNQSAWSANGTVLIDGTAPSMPGEPQATNPTNDNTPAWTWDASLDTGAGLHSTPYTVQWSSASDFSPVTGSTTSTTNSFTHSTPLGDGTWYIRVSARDALNNQSGYSATGQVTIDTVAPDVPDIPTTTSPTNDDTPVWAWTAPSDTGVGLSATPYGVEWSQDNVFGTVDGSDTSASNGFTQPSSLAEGTWYFRVRATDTAGNTSSFSDPAEVYIDITPPSVPGDPSTSDPVNDDTPTWTWLVSTDSGIGLDDPAYTVEWSTDNTFSSGVSSGQTNTNSFTHTAGLADGTWYFRVKATDGVGNESGWSNAGNKVVDINPPTVPGTPTTSTPTAVNTPAWSWAASSDAGVGLDETPYLIEWSQDEDFLVGVISDTITPASFTHTDPLADGTWYFRVRAQDDVGNISAYSSSGSVFIDASAPSTPGEPTTPSPTTDDTPTWNWTASSDGSGTGLATDGYIIEWSTAADMSVDMQSDTSSTNSFTHTDPLADGTWYFRVRAVDAVGNTSSDSNTGSIEIDDTAPSVPGQPSTATPTDDDTPVWSWTASTDNGVGMANPAYTVQWSTDNTFVSGVISDQINTNSFTHTDPLADGTWYFRVRTTDNLNNTSAYSATGSVLISTDGPTIPGTPVTTDPTTDTTPTWTWDASTSDAGLDTPPYSIEWSQDSSFLIGVMSDVSTTNSFTHTDPLADGTWYFRVRAADNTGLYSAYSASGSALVDTTAPTVPGSASTATPTNDSTPSWSWTASSDSGGSGLAANPYFIEWSTDNTFTTGVNSASSTAAIFTHTDPLADGTWYFRVRAIDILGNTSAFAAAGSVEVDAGLPDTPGTPGTDTPTSDQTPVWTWTSSNDAGVGLGNPAYQIAWSQSSSFSGGVTTATTNNTNFTHTDPLADGTWYFRVRAVDGVGNYSSYSSNGQVVVDASVPTVPGTPTTGASATNDDTPAWSWAAGTDSGTGLGSPAYGVQWSQDQDFLTGVSSATAATAGFTHGSSLSEGTWYFRVRAVDNVGNQSGYSGSGEVYVDTDTPTAPGTPTPAVSPTNDRTPGWTWTASTDSGFGFGLEPYEVQWSQAIDFSGGVTDGTSTSEAFTHAADLSDGTWYFRVRSVDDAGNQSAWSAAGEVVIDATAPGLPANLQTDTPTKDDTPEWTWDASSDDGVGLADPAYEMQWSKDEDFVSGVSSGTTNDPNFLHTSALDFGVWHFRIRVADQLGNETAWVESSVYIDSDPPVITTVTATPASITATVVWHTDEISSSQVEYGVGGNLDQTTAVADTGTRVTEHLVSLSGLTACTTYDFRVISIDQLDNEGVGTTGSFTTTACSGNAAIQAQSGANISAATGGQASLNSGSAALRLTVPSGFGPDDANFQIKQLSPAPALLPIGQPEGRSLVGSHVYDLKAVTPGNLLVTSFSGGLNVAINYTAAEAAGFNLSSLAIFRHDGSAWQQLSSCSVNSSAGSVSCTTSNFSVFGLFGTRVTPSAPLPEGEGTVEPEPEPPVVAKPAESDDNGPQAEAASDSRGLASTFTRFVGRVAKRPVWWVSLSLLIIATTVLAVLRRRHGEKHVPYGIHKDRD